MCTNMCTKLRQLLLNILNYKLFGAGEQLQKKQEPIYFEKRCDNGLLGDWGTLLRKEEEKKREKKWQ